LVICFIFFGTVYSALRSGWLKCALHICPAQDYKPSLRTVAAAERNGGVENLAKIVRNPAKGGNKLSF
jgi:hypothetical protein